MALHISLSIAKYSHGVGEKADDTAWNHFNAQDLCLVLKGDDKGALILLIVHATTTLESIDIASYLDEVIRMKRTTQLVKVQQMPIFGVTKQLLLQLIYRTPDSQARRIQLKFHNEEDCQQVVETLSRRGMTIQTYRDQSLRTARPGADADRLNTAHSDTRPLTALTNSFFFSQASQRPRSGGFRAPDHEARSLSNHPVSRTHDGHATSHNLPPPRTSTHDETAASQEAMPSRSSTSQFWRSQTQYFQPSFQESYTGERIAERPSSTSHLSTLEAIRQAAAEHDIPSMNKRNTESLSAVELPGPQWQARDIGSQVLPFDSTDSTDRPFTAASRTSVTSVLDLPPLQRPRLIRDESAASATTPSIAITSDHPPCRPFSALPTMNWTQEASNSKRGQTDTNSLMQGSRQNTHAAPPPFTSTKPILTAQIQPRGGPLMEGCSDSKMSRLDSNQDAPHEIESTSPAARAVSRLGEDAAPLSPTRRQPREDFVARAYSAVRSSSYNAEADILDQYAVQSPEDRQAALDQFMVENLENPAFTTLCEDVESCWRRIALGL